MKLFSAFLLVLGEALAIYAELSAAHAARLSGALESWSVLKNISLITAGGICLIFGYMYGVLAFESAWTVAVLSIVTILVIEPPLVLLFFNTMPGRGEILGFICGVLGILATLLISD